MFASLVVCLPSRHEGGTLIVSHDQQLKEIDFAGPQGEFKVQYAAFYADCRHEIKPVTQGYRVCLVYNLALTEGKRQPEAPRHSDKVDEVAGLLTSLFADGSLQKIAIPLKHEYTESGLSLDKLKGWIGRGWQSFASRPKRTGLSAVSEPDELPPGRPASMRTP